MKITLLFSAFIFCAFTFFGSLNDTVKSTNPHKDSVQKITQIATIRKTIDSIDSHSEGLCDTCVAAYKTVIIENRLLAKRISEQNYEMSKLIEQNDAILNRKRIARR
ncbi:hypothetical protein [Cellulophaga sp. BC115SP]|jgi:polyferredoxin|uniref:hypothetical protein n=1 Tax=Cellulophaga sp. BC115SP TaxID=2683263 RepID=UPI00141308CA|nr:hypothetical protein [Cellulophaga sp. BC115SP]NBB26772.1 hypothetical protein [Cellulophaga sp. BC115SP]